MEAQRAGPGPRRRHGRLTPHRTRPPRTPRRGPTPCRRPATSSTAAAGWPRRPRARRRPRRSRAACGPPPGRRDRHRPCTARGREHRRRPRPGGRPDPEADRETEAGRDSDPAVPAPPPAPATTPRRTLPARRRPGPPPAGHPARRALRADRAPGGLRRLAFTSADRLRDEPARQNSALTDIGRTSEVKGRISEAVGAVFSYDYASPERADRAARTYLTGRPCGSTRTCSPTSGSRRPGRSWSSPPP